MGRLEVQQKVEGAAACGGFRAACGRRGRFVLDV